ncbi:MAG: hypothetical protein HFG92_16365 [Dorea sp.]|jgi:hypothetical protein|nr:hypothetical protein [Dorea sp.]
MFVNEYVMDRRRYDKWATPKFWRLPIFYVYCLIFVAGVFGWIYFDKADAPARWQTIGAFLTFVAVYRGVFFNWMHADKTFRVTRQTYFNGQNWTCKVIVGEKNISLYINGKINNKVEWTEIKKFEEAKSYFKLSTEVNNEGVMIDKSSFIEGDSDSFRQWMLDKHPEIGYGSVAPPLNK